MTATEMKKTDPTRVVVTKRGEVDPEMGLLVEVPVREARPGKVTPTNAVVHRPAWPHEYLVELGTEVWL